MGERRRFTLQVNPGAGPSRRRSALERLVFAFSSVSSRPSTGILRAAPGKNVQKHRSGQGRARKLGKYFKRAAQNAKQAQSPTFPATREGR